MKITSIVEPKKTIDKGSLICVTKAEANRRILKFIPDWRQRNATARAVEIVNARFDGTATAADLSELADIAEVFNRVKAIRAASDLIEADIMAGRVINNSQICNSDRWQVE